jgi:drug/metabolite transporter (DMT)-like permease
VGPAGRAGGGDRALSRTVSAPAGATASDLPGLLAVIAARPRLAALLGAMSISFSGIFYRWSEVSPSTGTVFRCLFGLPFLAAVAYVERRKFGPLPATTVRLALIAGAFFAGDLTFWHHAIEYVGAGLATVLGNLQVLIVALVAWAVFGERPPRSVLVALPIVLLGVVLISGIVGTGAYGSAPAVGVLLGLLTACCYAGYLLIIRRGGRDLRRPAGPVAVATASTAVCAAVGGLVVGDLDMTPGPESLFWLAMLGITSQFLGYLLISLSLPRLPAVVTSIILLSQPVVTVALSMILLGEAPSPAQLAGVGLVIGGIAVATVPAGLARRQALRPSGQTGG